SDRLADGLSDRLTYGPIDGDRANDGAHEDGSRAFVERFLEAVKHAAYLRHPNIVQIQDIGIDERYCFVVMELLEGPSLASLLADGARLPLPRCVALLGQLAGALDYAHDANVPHEDVTPARIIVRAADHPTLLDFGMARLLVPADQPVAE